MMMPGGGIDKKEYLLCDIHESEKLAQEIAKSLKPSDIIAFYGDLGSGKTFFCQEIIRTLTNNPALNVISPTFNLLQTYHIPKSETIIYHYDLYRLQDQSELYELGIDEALNEKNICLIEWPELIVDILPKTLISVYLKIIENNRRSCIIK